MPCVGALFTNPGWGGGDGLLFPKALQSCFQSSLLKASCSSGPRTVLKQVLDENLQNGPLSGAASKNGGLVPDGGE